MDPKEVPLTESNNSCPRTKQQLLDWFLDGEDKSLPAFKKNLKAIVEHGWYENYPQLWNYIIDHNLDYDPDDEKLRNFWLTRTGRIWPCDFATHHRLANLLFGEYCGHYEDAHGYDAWEIEPERMAEQLGWIRFSGFCGAAPEVIEPHGVMRMSPQQERFIKKRGFKEPKPCREWPAIAPPTNFKWRFPHYE